MLKWEYWNKVVVVVVIVVARKQIRINSLNFLCEAIFSSSVVFQDGRPPEFTVILMFEFWREATATSVPGLLCQSGRLRPESVSILSSLMTWYENVKLAILEAMVKGYYECSFAVGVGD